MTATDADVEAVIAGMLTAVSNQTGWEASQAVVKRAPVMAVGAIAALRDRGLTPPREGWQNIASAPRDAEIDLWGKEHGCYVPERIANCIWQNGKWVHARTMFDDETDDVDNIYQVTHWRPLPASPMIAAAPDPAEGET